MADIFLSYRRDDSRADAGRIHDRLSQRFGHERVFMDVDDVSPGADFVELLHETLAHCGAVVVVIGRDWLGSDAGESRLDDPGDFVRLELATALRRGIAVFPVLVGGATLPQRDALPDELQPLLERQALEIRHSRFSDDCNRLINALARAVDSHGGMRRRTVLLGAAGAVLGLAGLWAGWGRLSRARTASLRAKPMLVSGDAARAMTVRHDFYHAHFNPAGGADRGSFDRRVVGNDVVIVDRVHRLMWQHGGTRMPLPADRARRAPGRLNDRQFAGFANWRLPTLDEAMSVMRATPTGPYHLPPQFDAASAPFVWTADRAGPGTGWVVYYADGTCLPEKETFNAYARAVRRLA